MRSEWDVVKTSICVLTALLLCVVIGAARAQDADSANKKPRVMAKGADPDWDVVTVKRSLPSDQGDSIHTDGGAW
jgi:hypothetical protein